MEVPWKSQPYKMFSFRESKRTFKKPGSIFKDIVNSMESLGRLRLSVQVLERYFYDGTKIVMLAVKR